MLIQIPYCISADNLGPGYAQSFVYRTLDYAGLNQPMAIYRVRHIKFRASSYVLAWKLIGSYSINKGHSVFIKLHHDIEFDTYLLIQREE